MKKSSNPSRVLALFTASVLSAGVLLQTAPARADKAKNYKYGAIALGAVGAYLLSKGKKTEAAIVLGAGAYTYKKGEDARKANDFGDYRDRYGARYPDNDNRYDTRYDDRYDDRYDARYDDRYDTRYDDRSRANVPARNRLSERDIDAVVVRGGNRYDGTRAGNRDRYNDRDRYDDNRNPKIR